MSEYQYYEFAALDEPLSDKQMKDLRALSTRAEITPTCFVNEYHWGDFRGDPRKLITSYFDAFLYYANWSTLWCMFRLPKDAVDLKAMKKFETEDAIDIWVKGKNVVVDICINDESGDHDVPYQQTLAGLLPVREELLEGDLGSLYVAWLAAVQRFVVEDDSPEPCAASQLGPLSTGARTLARFLCMDNDLLKSAFGAPRKKLRVDQPNQIAKWARALPQEEKDDYLASFIAEPANVVRSKLLKQYRTSQAAKSPAAKPAQKRTAGELRTAAGFD